MNELYPKKSLGQNFLTSESALQKIADAADIKAGEVVLEAGPGKGALTAKILEKGATVLAIEKDDRLIPFLQERFKKEIAEGKLVIENGDILEFSARKDAIEKGKFKIVANIPYYITGEFFRKFLDNGPRPLKMVVLVQKEVAERIVAKDNKESLLSISVKSFGEPKFIDSVKRGSFFPIPNVNSAILLVDNIHDLETKQPSDKKRFFEILHAGFAQKRKMLLGNLAETLGGREEAEKKLQKCNIDPKKRAENLKVEDWMCLAGQ